MKINKNNNAIIGCANCCVYYSQRPYLVRLTKEGVASTTLVDDVSDQVFLPIVGGEDTDAVRRVAQQTHVHVQSHGILCLCQVLHKKREKGRWQDLDYCISNMQFCLQVRREGNR